MEPNSKLVVLYQNMADLTAPECAGKYEGSCKLPHSCCDNFACQITKEYAKEKYGITLQEYPSPTYKNTLYLDGDKGCTVAPHLRPNCTMHTCAINGLGFKRGDPKWTKQYFALRNKIELMEMRSGK